MGAQQAQARKVKASHASVDALRADLAAAIKPLAPAVRGIQGVQAELREGDGEFLGVCQVALRAVLAVEALEAVAEGVKDDLRALLAGALEIGPGIVRSETHTASIGEAPRGVVITGEVPDTWMSAPKPTPDKRRIAEALKRGQALPFATLSNGGAPVLAIKARKE